MIPNAVTTIGPYADLWSHLTSIDHALERVIAAQHPGDVTALDRDRLRALQAILAQSLELDDDAEDFQFEKAALHEDGEPSYYSALDIRSQVTTNPLFKEWQKSSKKSSESKIQRLIKALDEYQESIQSPSSLFASPPDEEFKILRDIVVSLLNDAEAALVTY